MAIFFSSDQHYYHTNIITYSKRPYASIEEMNEFLVKNWNDVVGVDDIVYCLGDFSLAIRPVETFTPRLNGVKYLVPGNHDWCHSYNKKSRKAGAQEQLIQKYNDCGWIVLPEQTTLELPEIGIVNLCHLPYYLTHKADDKYAKWRPKDDGKWLLCGHVHEAWKTIDKMINVGVDQWNFCPVSLEQIKGIILNEKV